MLLKRTIGIIFSLVLAAFFNVPHVFAVTPPSFPSCTNPQGTLIASYDSGVHGVPGNSAEFTGSDKVYQVTDETLIQCLCTDNGDGTQTNWWRINSMDESEITQLKNLGWTFIPSGAAWGLEDIAYMAINSTFSCRTSATPTPTPQPSTSSSGGGQGGGEVLGAATVGEVLGLAGTGNITLLYGLFGIGVVALLLGFILRKANK